MDKDIYSKFIKKIRIKKLSKEQPIKIWLFVIFLNVIGFLGLYLINIFHINKFIIN